MRSSNEYVSGFIITTIIIIIIILTIIIIMSMTRAMKVIYDNTDQKDTTRLGEVWEWSTKVTVTRS